VIEVTDARQRNIAALIDPLRVQPGREVDLGRDFDPGWHSDLVGKNDGVELLRAGIDLLAEYQRRLAAQGTHGVLLCLQSLTRAARTARSATS